MRIYLINFLILYSIFLASILGESSLNTLSQKKLFQTDNKSVLYSTTYKGEDIVIFK